MAAESVFVEEWDVRAPIEVVFYAVADARTYPCWWTPVYLAGDSDGPPALGRVSRHRVQGRLPYQLRTRSEIVVFEPLTAVATKVEGDLAGYKAWALTPQGQGVHVRFDWRVEAERSSLRVPAPMLRPFFRWNQDWAVRRAMAGLEPYARQVAGLS